MLVYHFISKTALFAYFPVKVCEFYRLRTLVLGERRTETAQEEDLYVVIKRIRFTDKGIRHGHTEVSCSEEKEKCIEGEGNCETFQRCTNKRIQADTNTHTHAQTKNTHSQTQTHTLTDTNTHSHTQKHTLTDTNTHTHRHKHTLSKPHTHTHTHTHKHTHKLDTDDIINLQNISFSLCW